MPRIVDRKQKREQILVAALQIFAEIGYKNCKMSDIARAAHIGKGTIYEYFKSKEELLLASFDFLFQQLDRSTLHELEKIDDPEKQLRFIIRIYFTDFFKHYAHYLPLFIEYYMAVLRDLKAHKEHQVSFYKHYLSLVIPIFRKGIASGIFRPLDPVQLTCLFFAVLDGLYLQIFLGLENFDAEEIAETAADVFLRGIVVNNRGGMK